MIDPFDYKEPRCSLCDGKDFYNPKNNSPDGRIPIDRILAKTDAFYNCNDYLGAGAILEYWLTEAVSLNDMRGELSICSELIGHYRKTCNADKGERTIARAIFLLNELDLLNTVSGATILINVATALKSFGKPEQSLEYFKKAEETYLSNLKEDDEKFGGLYNNMALTYGDLNDFNTAYYYFEKAIEVMEKVKGGNLELAITYINIAHLLDQYAMKRESIVDSLYIAYYLLTDEKIVKNGYYAFVLEKCAPSFKYFGFENIFNEFTREYKKIYEGT